MNLANFEKVKLVISGGRAIDTYLPIRREDARTFRMKNEPTKAAIGLTCAQSDTSGLLSCYLSFFHVCKRMYRVCAKVQI